MVATNAAGTSSISTGPSSLFLIGVGTFFLTTSILFAGIAVKPRKRQRYPKKRRRHGKGKYKKKQQRKVSTGVGVIAFDQDTKKIVVGLRKNSHGANQWALPGGWLERGESFEGCALRELVEETGLVLKDNVESCELLETAPFLNKMLVPVSTPNQTTHQKTEEDARSDSSNEQQPTKTEMFYSVSAFVLIKLKRGRKHEVQIMEKDKCAEWKWIDPANEVESIGQYELFPSLKHLLSLNLNLALSKSTSTESQE